MMKSQDDYASKPNGKKEEQSSGSQMWQEKGETFQKLWVRFCGNALFCRAVMNDSKGQRGF